MHFVASARTASHFRALIKQDKKCILRLRAVNVIVYMLTARTQLFCNNRSLPPNIRWEQYQVSFRSPADICLFYHPCITHELCQATLPFYSSAITVSVVCRVGKTFLLVTTKQSSLFGQGHGVHTI